MDATGPDAAEDEPRHGAATVSFAHIVELVNYEHASSALEKPSSKRPRLLGDLKPQHGAPGIHSTSIRVPPITPSVTSGNVKVMTGLRKLECLIMSPTRKYQAKNSLSPDVQDQQGGAQLPAAVLGPMEGPYSLQVWPATQKLDDVATHVSIATPSVPDLAEAAEGRGSDGAAQPCAIAVPVLGPITPGSSSVGAPSARAPL